MISLHFPIPPARGSSLASQQETTGPGDTRIEEICREAVLMRSTVKGNTVTPDLSKRYLLMVKSKGHEFLSVERKNEGQANDAITQSS
jgi:hypothetical protein